MSAATVTATYSPTLTSILVPGTHLKQPDTTFNKFGVGVFLQTDGKARVQVVYAKWYIATIRIFNLDQLLS